MNKEEWAEYHINFCANMHATMLKKNHDYTGDSASPFANFCVVESVGICSTEQGFLTRMMDKMQRLATFVSKGTLKVNDESVHDTLEDLANYAILFSGYLAEKKEISREKVND